MAKEEKEKKEIWSVGYSVIDETRPPKKIFVNNNTDETLDRDLAIARILNEIEKLKKALM